MTKWEKTISFLRCNICDSLQIHFSDRQEDLDFCEDCYNKYIELDKRIHEEYET